MLSLQTTTDFSDDTAYKIGYELGYFIGNNLFLILGGILVFVLLLGFLYRRRKQNLQQDL